VSDEEKSAFLIRRIFFPLHKSVLPTELLVLFSLFSISLRALRFLSLLHNISGPFFYVKCNPSFQMKITHNVEKFVHVEKGCHLMFRPNRVSARHKIRLYVSVKELTLGIFKCKTNKTI